MRWSTAVTERSTGTLGGVKDADIGTAVGPWRRLSRRSVYANPWLEVFHDEVLRPDGSPGIYGVVHLRNVAVGIVPLDAAGRVLLVGQYRYPLDEYSWEIPEGGVDAAEGLLVGAQRELREETGYEAAEWRELFRFSMSNSVTDEVGAIFLATGLTPGEATPEPSEDITQRWVALDEAITMIERGEITDVMSVAGLLRVALERSTVGR
jgi:8-oxo-dGTP pyrophosphatase MutT (NUDIX family)